MSVSRGAIGALAAAGIVCGLVALALVLTGDHDQITGPFALLALTLGWSFIGTGLYALWRRPEQPIGRLMTVTGFLWFIGALPESDVALVFTVGLALAPLWSGPLVHLLIAFPTGRVDAGLERGLVRLGYAIPLLAPLGLLFLAQPSEDCPSARRTCCWSATARRPSTRCRRRSGAAGIVLLVGVLVVLDPPLAALRAGAAARARAGRVDGRRGGGLQRRRPGPAGDRCARARSTSPTSWSSACVTAVPFAFLAGLMRSSLSRASAVSALVERVGATSVRDALAEALGDRELTLAYWLPYPGGYVDADGRPVELPGPGVPRAVTEIEHDGGRVAAIVHDAALLEEPELVRAAGAAAGLALRNERLDAELRARYEELRASRARLVAAGDAARRKIERDLHDGAQQHLVSLALTLRMARTSAEAGSRTATLLDGAIEELKQGLVRAARARARHPPRGADRARPRARAGRPRGPRAGAVTVSGELGERLPPELESAAYFLVCEALTNVAKYASATEAEVSLRVENGRVVIDVRDDGIGGADAAAGSGLSGIADRVAALDGLLVVESPAGAGTLVHAELPHRAAPSSVA